MAATDNARLTQIEEAAWANPIARLNDQFRATLTGGTVAMTSGVMALGDGAVAQVLKCVRTHNDFAPENDTYEERDFGAFEWAEHRIFWKIDYYDKTLTAGSPDPANPSVTERVLTIMLASEY